MMCTGGAGADSLPEKRKQSVGGTRVPATAAAGGTWSLALHGAATRAVRGGISCLFILSLSLPLFSRVGCSVPGKMGCLERWGTGFRKNPPLNAWGQNRTDRTHRPLFCRRHYSIAAASTPSSAALSRRHRYAAQPSHICSSTAEENTRKVATEQGKKSLLLYRSQKALGNARAAELESWHWPSWDTAAR